MWLNSTHAYNSIRVTCVEKFFDRIECLHSIFWNSACIHWCIHHGYKLALTDCLGFNKQPKLCSLISINDRYWCFFLFKAGKDRPFTFITDHNRHTLRWKTQKPTVFHFYTTKIENLYFFKDKNECFLSLLTTKIYVFHYVFKVTKIDTFLVLNELNRRNQQNLRNLKNVIDVFVSDNFLRSIGFKNKLGNTSHISAETQLFVNIYCSDSFLLRAFSRKNNL